MAVDVKYRRCEVALIIHRITLDIIGYFRMMITVNIGNAMDIESGTFNTPVQGLYKFSVSYGGKRGGPERILVKKNGDHVFDIIGASYSWMFSLDKDDTITLFNEADLDVGRTRHGPGFREMHLYFTGQLI